MGQPALRPLCDSLRTRNLVSCVYHQDGVHNSVPSRGPPAGPLKRPGQQGLTSVEEGEGFSGTVPRSIQKKASAPSKEDRVCHCL
jgi:hypothetical protein